MTASAPSFPDLAGKAVLVTGASTGIGAALVRAYAAQGCRVGLHYNQSRDAAEALAAELRERGRRRSPHAGRFLRSGRRPRGSSRTRGAFRRARRAGQQCRRHARPRALCRDDRRAVRPGHGPQRALRRHRLPRAIPWLKRQGGFIVNTSSIAARNGGGGGAGLYGSAKAFVSNVHARHGQGADRRRHPRQRRGAGHHRARLSTSAIRRRADEGNGRRRARRAAPAPPEDCVGAYLFLSSGRLSGYITGQVIEVNGGQLMP